MPSPRLPLLLLLSATLSVSLPSPEEQPLPVPFSFAAAPARALEVLPHSDRWDHQFRWLLLNGSLYVPREFNEIGTRATSSTHGLLQALWSAAGRGEALPQLAVTLLNTGGDFETGSRVRERREAKAEGLTEFPLLSFFRVPGEAHPATLWPDHDVFGWPFTWVAPFPLLAAQFKAEEKGEEAAWARRDHRLLWSGAVLGAQRREFLACAGRGASAGLIKAKPVQWRAFRDRRMADGRAHKSLSEADLRVYSHYRYALFLPGVSWSSSLKRMAAAGPALFIPNPPQFEDLATLALAGCGERCVFEYNPNSSALCEELGETLAGTGAEEAKRRAEASTHLIRSEFGSWDVLGEYMLGTLRRLAGAQDLSGLRAEALTELGYEEADCAWLKRRYQLRLEKEGLWWQVQEWMGDDCRFLAEAPYLGTVAL
jgi:Glycosyl transferase family 90